MKENENLVTEEVTENAEQTAEETPKMYSQQEVDAIVGKSKARASAKVRKEYERKYGKLEEVLRAGTGKENISEIADSLTNYYAQQGVEIPDKPLYSQKDIEVLATAEANDVINSGFDEVLDEVNRLSELGVDRMSDREKLYFKQLEKYKQKVEKENELKKIGVGEDEYGSLEFKDFVSLFNDNIPIKDIYNIYAKTKHKKEIEPMGSMQNKTSDEGTIKDFYTRDEALKFTKKDFDKNPELFKAVQESMLKW